MICCDYPIKSVAWHAQRASTASGNAVYFLNYFLNATRSAHNTSLSLRFKYTKTYFQLNASSNSIKFCDDWIVLLCKLRTITMWAIEWWIYPAPTKKYICIFSARDWASDLSSVIFHKLLHISVNRVKLMLIKLCQLWQVSHDLYGFYRCHRMNVPRCVIYTTRECRPLAEHQCNCKWLMPSSIASAKRMKAMS